MTSEGDLRCLTVLHGGTHRWHHKPLYVEIVHRAQRAGLAGASVLKGIEGFGASNHLHTVNLLALSEDLPIMVVLVDTVERIEAFLPQLEEVLETGLVTVEQVRVHPSMSREQAVNRA
jgi:PII-like signaling protein